VNRIDRLYAIVEELRARAPRLVPAPALADQFEVHIRTVERDISALQQAGVPIWSQRGGGGGYGIDPSRTLPPLNLSAREATAVAIALAAAGPIPYGGDARSAARKVAAVLAGEAAEHGDELASRIRVTRSSSAADRSRVTAIEDAVAARRVVTIDYVDGEGRATSRQVEAHGLYRGEGHWYLIGWCRLREGGRLFRLDRIGAVAATDEFAPGRDLDTVLGWVPGETERPSLTFVE